MAGFNYRLSQLRTIRPRHGRAVILVAAILLFSNDFGSVDLQNRSLSKIKEWLLPKYFYGCDAVKYFEVVMDIQAGIVNPDTNHYKLSNVQVRLF